MPLQIFLSHASVDKPLVEEVKQSLEDGGDIKCWLDAFEIGLGENISVKIQDGLKKSDLLLVFLSSTSVKSRWVEEEWTKALWKQVNSGEVRLIPVLIGDCELPTLLEDKKYCDLRTNRLEAMRVLKTQLLGLKPRPAADGGSRASLPNFVGREAELEELKARLSQPGALVPITGMPGVGKTFLAREFLRRNADLFEAVYELDCQKKNLAALTGELNMKLGLALTGDAEKVAGELRQHLAGKRCLLLLDNVEDDQPGALVPGGKAAVLVTARIATIPFFADYPGLCPQPFTDTEAREMFRRVLGEFSEDAARRLFVKLGYLPIGVTVAAGLIKHDVRYTVESLAETLPVPKLKFGRQDVSGLLGEAIGALDEAGRTLLKAMAACAPGGTRFGLAAEVAGFEESQALDALQHLFERSLVLEIDRAARRYRLPPLIRDAASPGPDVRRKHAHSVARRVIEWEKAPLTSADLIEEAEEALRAWTDKPEFLVAQIALEAGNLAQALARWGEAQELYQRMERIATEAARKSWLEASYGNQALILRAWGRIGEALALHKKEEQICVDIGDRAGLQRSYGNQALILKGWGRLDEAMALHKKEEQMCVELADRAGLAASYANQALILKGWSRLDEAMALLKKQEQICVDIGDRAGLRASYGGQALVLQDEGRLDDAMALHKKEEQICVETGDRAGLVESYVNQALILRAWGRPDEAMALLKKQEQICLEIGERAGLAASYGNQAVIFQVRGQFDDAMALHKKEEQICQELGDRAGLARCYGNVGLIERERKNFAESRKRLEQALAIFTELKIPREREIVLANLKTLPAQVD